MLAAYSVGTGIVTFVPPFGAALIAIANGWLGDVLTHKYITTALSVAISTVGYSLTVSGDNTLIVGYIIESFGFGILFCILPAGIAEPGSSFLIATFKLFLSGLFGSILGFYGMELLTPATGTSISGFLAILSAALLVFASPEPMRIWNIKNLPVVDKEEAFTALAPISDEKLLSNGNNDKHPYDYYYRVGAQLRPLPHRSMASPQWLPMRKRLLSRYINVQAEPSRTPLVQLVQDHLWQGDELMDAVVSWGHANGMSQARSLLIQSLDRGIEAVLDAPIEIKELFKQLDRKPSWYTEDDYERGRVVLANASPVGRLVSLAITLIITALSSSIGNAVGSTTQYVNPKTFMRRHLETVHFFHCITLPGGSDRFSETFKEIVKVRFMHCQVRRALKNRWGREVFSTHGNPISNSDMAFGINEFGTLSLAVEASLGRCTPMSDLNSASRHWGYIAYIFGVAEDIIPRNFQEAVEIYDAGLSSYGEAPESSPQIANAMLVIPETLLHLSETPFWRRCLSMIALPFFHGLVYYFGGKELGYGLLSARYKSRFRMELQAVFAITAARLMITMHAVLEMWPGRESRMKTRAAKGSPVDGLAMDVFGRAAAKAGVRHVNFKTHDHSNPNDFKTLKKWV